jgi:hypothetical protein
MYLEASLFVAVDVDGVKQVVARGDPDHTPAPRARAVHGREGRVQLRACRHVDDGEANHVRRQKGAGGASEVLGRCLGRAMMKGGQV